jgi:OOP family OmpA-OmpF porin
MKKHILAALAVVAFSGAASAQVYGTASVGASRFSLDCSGATSCDKNDTAFKVMGGYKFMPNLAAEIGYFDFGKAKASLGPLSGAVKLNGYGIGAAYLVDFGSNWNGVARLGVGRMKTKVSATGFGSDSDTNTTVYGGLGVGYRLTPAFSIDGAWDISRAKSDKNGVNESGNVNALSVGVTYLF